MNSQPLDLLRETRDAQGLPDPTAAAASGRKLLLKGGLIGAAVLSISIGVTVLLFLRQQMLSAELDRLAMVEADVQAAETRLTAARTALNTLKQGNQTLVKGLVNPRSGSALMRDLQRRVPQGIQLTTVDVDPGGTSLRLQGLAGDPMAFGRINALQIELSRSPLLIPSSLQLIKASRDGGNPTGQGSGAAPAALVSFELTAQFRPALPPVSELQILSELGATGMAKRMRLLQAEGLLP